jgi:hemophore-related protein
MAKLSSTRLAVAVGGLTLSLTAGAGVACADPDLGPAVNTTCTYDQVMAAMNAQDPTVAGFFTAWPPMQAGLLEFLAGSPSQRTEIAQRFVSDPHGGPYIGVLQRTFETCNSY